MQKDYYKILGVDKNASEEDIKKAYRKIALSSHPDRQVGKSEDEKKKAEETFKEANEAFSVIGDKEKRANYDRFGTADVNQGFGGGGFNPFEFFRRQAQNMGGFSRFNPFSSFDDDSDFPGFGFNNSQGDTEVDPNAPQNGQDIKIKINIPLEYSLYGHKTEMRFRFEDACHHCNGTGSEDGKQSTCPHCHGKGMITQRHGMMIMSSTCPHCRGTGRTISNLCSHCHGSGKEEVEKTVKITIPQGIGNEEFFTVNGEGKRGINGGKNGNLLLMVNVENNEIFERNDLDLSTETFISPIKASIGGTADVMTPWGVAKLKIPEGTENGKRFRISGKGVKANRGIGDLYVKVNIEPIVNLTSEQKKLLEQLESTITQKNLKKSSELKMKCDNFEKEVNNMKK